LLLFIQIRFKKKSVVSPMDSFVALASWYLHFCRESMLELPINCDSRIVCYRIALQRKCAYTYTRMCAFRIHKGKQLSSLALTQKESKSNAERVKRGHRERW